MRCFSAAARGRVWEALLGGGGGGGVAGSCPPVAAASHAPRPDVRPRRCGLPATSATARSRLSVVPRRPSTAVARARLSPGLVAGPGHRPVSSARPLPAVRRRLPSDCLFDGASAAHSSSSSVHLSSPAAAAAASQSRLPGVLCRPVTATHPAVAVPVQRSAGVRRRCGLSGDHCVASRRLVLSVHGVSASTRLSAYVTSHQRASAPAAAAAAYAECRTGED